MSVAHNLGRALPARTATLSMRDAVRYSLCIRRVEFLPTTMTIILVPALLLAGSGAAFGTATFVAVAVMIRLIIHFGDMVNCLADRDVDAIYKTRLSDAVYGLGLANVRWQIRVTGTAILALAAYLAVTTRHWDILLLIVVELYFARQYSVPPLHLKGAGGWQIPTLFVIIYGLPMLLVARAFPIDLGWPILLVVAGFGVSQVGVIVVNTAEDLPEDEEYGIRTSVLALGLSRAIGVATAMVGVGGVALTVGVLAMGEPSWGLVALVAAYGWALLHVGGTWLAVRGRSVDAALKSLRLRAKLVPVQLAVTGWGTVLAAAFVLANR